MPTKSICKTYAALQLPFHWANVAHTLRLTASSQLRLPPSPLRQFPCGPLSLSPHRQLLTNHLPFGCISLLAFFRCGCHWHVPQILSAICRQKSRYLSPCLSLCLSVYLSLSSLSSWQFVCHSAPFSACLSIGFSAASISQPQQRMYLPHCVSRYLSLCPNCCCCYSQCSWPFFTLHLSQSPPPSSETTPANLRLPPLQSYALLVLVCRRRVPQIAACVRCSKQTNKNQNTNNNKINNKWQQQQQQAEPASSKKFNETAVEKAAKA